MTRYNVARTVFASSWSPYEWYILPAGEAKARWWKRYLKVPGKAKYWCEYMNVEERDKLVAIYDDAGGRAFEEACAYLDGTWFWRKMDAEDDLVDRGRERFQG